MKPKITYVSAKSIVTKSKLPDAEYVLNPASGCDHGCTYCYAVFTRRFSGHVGDAWGSYVDVKTNAVELIHRMNDDTLRGRHVLLSSVTDPYQRCEGKIKNTRRVLKALLPKQPRLEILTKGTLYVRDFDVLTQFEDVTIGTSLSTIDSKISRAIEPGAPLPKARLRALRRAHDAGVKTYVFISPILPYITDVDAIVEEAFDTADRIMLEELNMGAGTYEALVTSLESMVPGLREKYDAIRREPSAWWGPRKAKLMEAVSRKDLPVKYYSHHRGKL